ncbi:MAG: hypothetical protein IBX72_16245 [Nitrospirae bacterium]|jgi:hypothetical protein|nr:hypothetical protein [Nitrospirota bacterium]
MKTSELYKKILDIAVSEFKVIIESGQVLYSQSGEPWKLRLYLYDNSFIDIYYSIRGKYSYHWDRRLTSNKIYRHDNAPHEKWKDLPTFPKHFHNGSEDTVVSSDIDDNPELAVRQFLKFAASRLLKE